MSPILRLGELEFIREPGMALRASSYKYERDSLPDDREFFDFYSGPSAVFYLEALKASLPEGRELALHSSGWAVDGSLWHWPMLDLACASWSGDERGRLEKFLPSDMFGPWQLFHSGRSFHVYGGRWIPNSMLHDFLARALLANPVDAPKVVDDRWIAHRLMSGWLSLRLSANSTRSVCEPAPIRWDLDWPPNLEGKES